MKHMEEKGKKVYLKKLLKVLVVTILVAIFAVTSYLVLRKNSVETAVFNQDSELLRAMNYEQFLDGDSNVEGTDNVKFSAFFLRDLNGDGYAEKIKGTCKEVGKEDTLYMEVIVQSTGYLKNAKIEIDGKNFYLQTALPKDNELKTSYVGTNVKKIEFENLQSGTQKLMTGIVRSGDYTYSSSKYSAIGNNINNYSIDDNKVILTGTYVSESGTETELRKEINLGVDWYGYTGANIVSYYNGFNYRSQENDINGAIDEENSVFKINFKLKTEETRRELLLQKVHIDGIVPELNGYKPLSVNITGINSDFNYDDETREFSVERNSSLSEDGIVSSSVTNNNYNDFDISIEYPLEAYQTLGSDTVEYKFPVNVFYTGYNNDSDEFSNPYQSNIDKDIIVVNVKNPTGDAAIFKTKVGKYVYSPFYRYMISKEKPLNLYNGLSERENNDLYTVTWIGTVGTDYDGTNLLMKERRIEESGIISDKFIDYAGNETSMDDITGNIAISFSNQENVLGEDGWIRIYDDENNYLIETFNKKNWNNYSQENPYYFETHVKHIRVETSAANKETTLYVHCLKEIDDEALLNRYDRSTFDSFKYIKTTLVGYLGESYINTDVHQANYEEKMSVLEASINESTFSTAQTKENVHINISPRCNEENNQTKWKNGIFLLKFPSEIIDIKINSITSTKDNIEILSSEKYEENGNIYVKIITTNEDEDIYSLDMDVDVTPDPRVPTITRSIEIYGYNEVASNYHNAAKDTYDINGNGNKEDTINKANISVNLFAPNSLITSQTITAYDDEGTSTIAPNIALVDIDQKEAVMEVNVTNNYSGTISDTLILGRIPFEGNKYPISEKDMGSTFTTKLLGSINVPEKIRNSVKIYYSENENASKDLYNSSNGWKENPTDYSNIKSFLIDFQSYRLSSGESLTFTYNVSIPDNVNYNDVSYGNHGIYFSLDTESGKYRTQTEPNKVGLMIVKQYNLKINKQKFGAANNVQGAIYSVETTNMPNGENVTTVTTNEDGNAVFNKLNVGKEYVLREIKSPDNYVLSNESVKFIGDIDKNGNLIINIIEGNFSNNIIIDGYSASACVKDKSKYDMTVNKIDANGNPVGRIKFRITDERGKEIVIRTGTDGVAVASGLEPDLQYYFEEIKADGYYKDDTRYKFKAYRDEEGFKIESDNEIISNASINEDNEKENVSFTITNERIPMYSMSILKIEKDDPEKHGLANAKFMLASDDSGEYEIYKTDENGYINISSLFAYVEGKNVLGTYTLQEISAPNGYVRNKDSIRFKVTKNADQFDVNILNQDEINSLVSYAFENNELKFEVSNKPTFTLSKQDKENGAYLKDAKFVIYRVDNNNQVLDYAKDSFGNYLGEKDEDGRYIITTNEDGLAKLAIAGGKYKAIEVQAPDGYILEEYEWNRTKYFSIQGQQGDTDVFEINYIENLVAFSKSVNNGNLFEGKKITLLRNLDFNDDASYNNPADTQYGDINGDGKITGIKDELTNREGQGFNPIGTSTYYALKGIFDGNNYELSNLYIKRNSQYLGLFGCIGTNSVVKNITISGYVEGTNTGSSSYVGGIVGYNYDGRIVGCKNKAKVTKNSTSSTSLNIGGVAAYSTYIEKSANEGIISVTGNYNSSNVGGVVGSGTTIVLSYNVGPIYVDATKSTAGGIAGYLSTGSFLYNRGDINIITTDTSKVAGIVGSLNEKINSSYNTGNIEAVGDLISASYIANGKKAENSYYNSTITLSNTELEITDSGLYVEDEELKHMSVNLNGAFDIWSEDEESINDGYPILTGDISNDYIKTINTIEDLVIFSNIVNDGLYDYTGEIVTLNRTIDFNDDSSYVNPNSTIFGDLNRDGTITGIKSELTDISGIGFSPIGKTYYSRFNGTFKGNNHEIKNIYINSNQDRVGLFGTALNVDGVGVSGKIISNNEGESSTFVQVGGVAGYCTGRITNCYSNTEIECNNNRGGYIGGIVGAAKFVSNSYNLGSIKDYSTTTYYRQVAGIVGDMDSQGRIENCFNAGDILITQNSNAYACGIVGAYFNLIETFEVKSCYNIGTITGIQYVGQILYGSNTNYSVSDCYYIEGNVSGRRISSPGKRMTQADMLSNNFVNMLNTGTMNWNKIDGINNGYPLPNNIVSEENLKCEINYIEDLVDFSKQVNSGYTFNGKIVELKRDLDFKNVNSYRNAYDTSYGDINEDGTIKTIKEELTNTTAIKGFPMIGNYYNGFEGTFEGNDYLISNIYIYGRIQSNGFFVKTNNANIKNLSIQGTMKTYYADWLKIEQSGGIIGSSYDTIITNCTSSIDIEKVTSSQENNFYIGGVVGYANNLIIDKCNNTGTIKISDFEDDKEYLGGIVGYGEKVKIYNCNNSGSINYKLDNYSVDDVSSRNVKVGGIIGYATGRKDNWVYYCSNTGFIDVNINASATRPSGLSSSHPVRVDVGGISGSGVDIRNCYCICDINNILNYRLSSDSNTYDSYSQISTGGICGDGSNTANTYYVGNINARANMSNDKARDTNSSALYKGPGYYSRNNTYNSYAADNNYIGEASPKYDNEMKTQDFVNLLNNGAGRDNVWRFVDGTYPKLNEINVDYNTVGVVDNEATEIIFENEINKYKITTDVLIDSKIKNNIELVENDSTYPWVKDSDGVWSSTNQNKQSSSTTLKSEEFSIEAGDAVTFDWTVSSESASYDYIYYTIKNVETDEIIGGTNTKIGGTSYGTVYENLKWNNVSKELPEGRYTIEFTYRKDGSVDRGLDQAFVKNLSVKEMIKGGTISGEDEQPYETIIWSNNSTKEIKMVPDEGYTIKNIWINGEEYDYIENDDGSYTLPLFENVREDKHIEVMYSNKIGQVVERHMLANKKDDGGYEYTEIELSPAITNTGTNGLNYSIKPKMDYEKYELIKDGNGDFIIPDGNNLYYESDAASGVYEANQKKVVIYYYTQRKCPLVVNHLVEGTDEPVILSTGEEASQEISSGNEGETYTTNPLEASQIAEKYELSLQLPDNAEGIYTENETVVNYYYRIKKFNITTEVEEYEKTNILGETEIIKGGTISGEGLPSYEKVEYDENSIEDIIVEPDPGYEIKSIKINDEPIDFAVEPDGKVTLSKFIGVRKNINVSVSFDKEVSQVIVHHYMEGTENKMPSIYGGEVQDETKRGSRGDPYATKASDEISPRYELVSEPQNSSGNFDDETIEVIYYYREVPAKVITNHLVLGTTNPVPLSDGTNAQAVTVNGYVTKPYTTVALTNIDSNYVLVKDSGNTKGEMTREDIVVNYYYAPKAKAKVNYIAVNSDDTETVMETIDYEGYDTEEYTSHSKDFPGYTLTDVPEYETAELTKDATTVFNYYYRKNTGLVEKHVDLYTGEIKNTEEHEGIVGTEYQIDRKVFEGYKIATNKKYYEKLVKDNPEILSTNSVETVDELLEALGLNANDPYIPKNYKGEMKEDTIEVIYYYVKDAKVIVEYHDINEDDPTKPIHQDDIIPGLEKDPYKTESIEIDGYDLVTDPDYTPTNAEGEMTEEDIIVKYYYVYKTDVVVNYIDISNESKIDSDKKEGHEKDLYKMDQMDLTEHPNYRIVTNQEYYEWLVGKDSSILEENGVTTVGELLAKLELGALDPYIPANYKGEMTKDEIVVNYYYKKQAKVTVKHIDEATGTVLKTEEATYDVGDTYTTGPETIENYTLNEDKLPGNATGEVKEGGVEVKYYYNKKTTPVTPDSGGNTPIPEPTPQPNPNPTPGPAPAPQPQPSSPAPQSPVVTTAKKIYNKVLPRTGDTTIHTATSIIIMVVLLNMLVTDRVNQGPKYETKVEKGKKKKVKGKRFK